MDLFEIVLLTIAYTLGIITLFLEIICYKRNLETIEIIFFTVSFLILMLTVSYVQITNPIYTSETHISILISMILLALTTPLSVISERRFYISPLLKKILIIFSFSLMLVTILDYYLKLSYNIEFITYFYLIFSLFFSMIIMTNTKPISRIIGREKIEKIVAVICLTILPFSIAIDAFSDKIPFISDLNLRIGFTIPLFFIFITTNKLLDDIKRLSLFKSDNILKDQNLNNYAFTNRELEVVKLLIKGATYRQVGEQLFISIPTVKTHVSNIYKKAQVNNKIELVNLLT